MIEEFSTYVFGLIGLAEILSCVYKGHFSNWYSNGVSVSGGKPFDIVEVL